MNESLDKNQKRVRQLGPTEKVGKNGPRGKLVGANESADGNAQSTKMFLEVDDDDELLDEADLIISPALFGKGDRSFKSKHADHEVSMARNDCYQSAMNALKIYKLLLRVSEQRGIDGWVASKITLAADYLNTVREYLEGQQLERNSMQGVAEEKLDELKCWSGYTRVQGVPAGAPGSCKKKSKTKESVTEGDDSGDYATAARNAHQASQIAMSRSDHEKAVYLHNKAATYALSAGKDESVVNNHQAAAHKHSRAAKGLKEDVAEGTVHPGDLYNVVIEYFNGGKGYRNAMALRKKAEKGMSINDLANLLNTFVMNKWGSKLKRSDSIDAVKNIVYPHIVEQDETEGSYKRMKCPECGGAAYGDEMLAEKKDACYHKVKSRYKVWPSAYASGALVKCRKVGAKNWGNKSGK